MVFEGFEIKEKLKVLKFYRLETILILFGYQRQEEAFAVCYMNQTFQQYSNFFLEKCWNSLQLNLRIPSVIWRRKTTMSRMKVDN